MRFIKQQFLAGAVATMLLAGCAARPVAEPERAVDVINWGEPANGLRAGLAAAVAPDYGGTTRPVEPDHVRLYLQNVGSGTITVAGPLWPGQIDLNGNGRPLVVVGSARGGPAVQWVDRSNVGAHT